MKRKIIFIFANIWLCQLLAAQTIVEPPDTKENDLQLRAEAVVTKKLNRHATFYLGEEVRFKNDLAAFDRSYTYAGLDFRFNPYFKTGLAYNFIFINHDGKKSTNYEKYWTTRHRISVDIVGNLRLNQWKFTLRERPMLTLRFDSINPLEKNKLDWVLRSKLGAEYTVRSLPLKPYASVELSNTLNAITISGVNQKNEPITIGGNYIDKIRSCIGLKYRINARNSFDFYYRLDYGKDWDINYDYKKDNITLKQIKVLHEQNITHIIGITYHFDWL